MKNNYIEFAILSMLLIQFGILLSNEFRFAKIEKDIVEIKSYLEPELPTFEYDIDGKSK